MFAEYFFLFSFLRSIEKREARRITWQRLMAGLKFFKVVEVFIVALKGCSLYFFFFFLIVDRFKVRFRFIRASYNSEQKKVQMVRDKMQNRY